MRSYPLAAAGHFIKFASAEACPWMPAAAGASGGKLENACESGEA
ncbi:hypothetical protein [Rosistilla oblonga]|nr:hypothetical protein [Rosistilla oblonga]